MTNGAYLVDGFLRTRIIPDLLAIILGNGRSEVHFRGCYAVSEMANGCVSEEIKIRVLGHKLKSVHQAYTHLGLGVLKDAAGTVY